MTNLPLLLAETKDWIVLNKPPGWLSIAPSVPSGEGAGESAPVLFSWANKQYGKLWIVHRLDIQTSGVILFAKSEDAHRRANDWFSSHQVRKTYYALAAGRPVMPAFQVKAPVAGKPATSLVEVIEQWNGGFLAQVMPRTGRRHQIRVHLAEEGFPIWGDTTYGGALRVQWGERSLDVNRVALHAFRLALPSEGAKSGEVFEAPCPEDFAAWLKWARGES